MKTIIFATALSILYAPAYACGNGECDPHPDEPGIETPDKPTEPEPEKPTEPQPQPEKPAPEKPQPETPAPGPSQPERPADRPTLNRDAGNCDGWDRRAPECRPQPRPYSLAAISDQSYVPSEKWAPLPQVCERTWFTLRYSIPHGMTKAAARQRCVEWLEGEL